MRRNGNARRGLALTLVLAWTALPAHAQVIANLGAETAVLAGGVRHQLRADRRHRRPAAGAGRGRCSPAIAGVVVFVFTVAGAAAYGARDAIIALAGG
ncbi:hypothetical protein [Azospirillum sp. INR13]|uniref:hypothetical protein n=1 Tax=Azospirillum sp. INR13 TaxID=2596919 RepID=UPI002107652D|nr:hypothetical protein [Azospirillum sp. INR13]